MAGADDLASIPLYRGLNADERANVARDVIVDDAVDDAPVAEPFRVISSARWRFSETPAGRRPF